MRLWPLAVVLSISAPTTARAYEVKKSSSGAELHWPAAPVVFAPVTTPSPSTITPADAQQVLEASLATWQAALDGTDVQLAVGDPVTGAAHTADGINQIRWATAANDPDIEKGVLALTFVAFRTDTGEIADADVVLNAAGFRWTPTMTGCADAYDLQSALTHELGHALGLAHAVGHTDATMFATSDSCDSAKRDLAKDDEDAIAHLYESSPEPGGCSSGGSPGAGMLAVLAILLARRRSRTLAIAALAASWLGAASVEAAQLHRLELDELARASTLVVRGRVIATATTPAGAIEIDTDVMIDSCYGAARACPMTVRVRRRGGVRGEHGVWVDGEAAASVGTEVVMYLRRDAAGTYRVVGGVQGLFRVIGDRAVRDLRGHQVLDRVWEQGGVDVVELAVLRQHAACSSSAP